MTTSIKQLNQKSQFTSLQSQQISKEKAKLLKGGNIIVEEIVLG